MFPARNPGDCNGAVSYIGIVRLKLEGGTKWFVCNMIAKINWYLVVDIIAFFRRCGNPVKTLNGVPEKQGYK
jgi:hypothetical protein